MILCRYVWCANVLLGTLLLTATMEPAAAQLNRRGFSSRGVNPVGSRTSSYRGPVISGASRSYNAGFGAYNAGPLGLSPSFYYGLTNPYYYSGDYFQSDMGSQGDAGASGENATSSSRPNVRPRLDIAARDAVNSNRVLQSVQQSVLKQIAACAERPFSKQWYVAHPAIPPIGNGERDAWQPTDWANASRVVGVTAKPSQYEFRPDKMGLIHVYRDGAQQERAVDAREPAMRLAAKAEPLQDDTPVLTMGVFAAVPPTDEPVKSLVHIAIHSSGAVTGYQYDFATDSTQPLQGALDPESQRVAWQVGSNYAETGLKGLTEELTRFLLFREDGWTQPWILMRISDE